MGLICGGEIKCESCGCTDIRILQINHKNCDGNLERKSGVTPTILVRKILNGVRAYDDLNILCVVCNMRHFYENKYGKLPYTIIWNGEEKCDH